jgi:hypothetical protein
MTTNLVVWAYFIYLPIALSLTFYVAHQLFANGKVFMLDIFHGKESIAFSTNQLFKTGFYLINVGYALLILPIGYWIGDTQTLIEVLSGKLGGFAIYLGVSLFFTLYLFMRGRRISRSNTAKQQAAAQGDSLS